MVCVSAYRDSRNILIALIWEFVDYFCVHTCQDFVAVIISCDKPIMSREDS